MFDDQPINNQNTGVPSNLPIGEPEDMFAGVDDTPVSPPAREPAVSDVTTPQFPSASALGAGVLRPKTDEPLQADYPSSVEGGVNQMRQPENLASRPSSVHPQEIYQIKEPAIGKGIVRLVVIGVVVVILGGGSWWIYNSFMKDTSSTGVFGESVDFEDVALSTDFVDENLENVVPVEDVVVEETVGSAVVDDLTGTVIDDQVLFGEPIDKDVDGLDDDTEINIGTDPNNWDSDGDELSDGDEVSIWKTDPLNPDTDGDTYLDGAEIKSVYSPTGPGKLFEPSLVE